MEGHGNKEFLCSQPETAGLVCLCLRDSSKQVCRGGHATRRTLVHASTHSRHTNHTHGHTHHTHTSVHRHRHTHTHTNTHIEASHWAANLPLSTHSFAQVSLCRCRFPWKSIISDTPRLGTPHSLNLGPEEALNSTWSLVFKLPLQYPGLRPLGLYLRDSGAPPPALPLPMELKGPLLLSWPLASRASPT